jgi:hypothetical protein
VHHGRFGSPHIAGEKQGRAKGHMKRTWHCIHRHKKRSFRTPAGQNRAMPLKARRSHVRPSREFLIDVINKGPFGPLHVFGIS